MHVCDIVISDKNMWSGLKIFSKFSVYHKDIVNSETGPVGVTQDLILGLLLFIISIKDMCTILILLYATKHADHMCFILFFTCAL